MTIYATPFDSDTLQATAASADSGFADLAEVIDTMGPEHLSRGERSVIYPGLMFSDYAVRLEP